MKKSLISALKVLVPLGLGIWLVYYFYAKFSLEQRDELFTAFKQANFWWIAAASAVSVCSHIARAWRWRYLLEPLGHNVGFWNAFNATMSGYFMNMLIQRSGEASRAALLYRAEGVPFEKGFGTILAERTVDLVMLLVIVAITLSLQLEMLDVFQQRIEAFSDEITNSDNDANYWVYALAAVFALGGIVVLYLIATREALRARLKDTVRGFAQGVFSVFRTKNKKAFIIYTVLIWVLYVVNFWLGFFAIPSTTAIPAAGVLAGFVAGTFGVIIVQGGIGVYPALVGLILSIYLPLPEGGGLVRPDTLALGWLLWISQTLLTIIIGGISLFLISRKTVSP